MTARQRQSISVEHMVTAFASADAMQHSPEDKSTLAAQCDKEITAKTHVSALLSIVGKHAGKRQESCTSRRAYCVHILDPDGIHRAIKDHPLAVRGGIPGCVTEEHSQDAVSPFLGGGVLCTIQLPHGHSLGVQNVGLHMLLIVQALRGTSSFCAMLPKDCSCSLLECLALQAAWRQHIAES